MEPAVVAVLGEALVDLTPADLEGRPVFVAHAGGSPFNVAVTLGRLGAPTRFLGRLSTDRFGVMLRDRLVAEGVDVTRAPVGEEPTAVALVDLDDAGNASYRFLWEGTADRMLSDGDLPGDVGDLAALHVGSVSRMLEPGSAVIDALVARARDGCVISYDPNIRPQLIGAEDVERRRLAERVAAAHLVKVSEEDLRWSEPDGEVEDIARHWLDLGPSLVVVTLGGAGALAVTRRSRVQVPGVDVEVRDTVGAGDSFAGALLASLHAQGRLSVDALGALDEAALRRALTTAANVAALTCTRPGADPPRLTDLPADVRP